MEIIKSGVAMKRKRVSKKKKSSWRKHSCVGEVEEYLENKRQQDRVVVITDENVDGFFEKDNKLTPHKRNKRQLLDSHKLPISTSKVKSQLVRKADPSKVVNLTRSDLKKTKDGWKGDGLMEEEEEGKKEIKKMFDVWSGKEEIDELELYRRIICRIHPVKPPSHHHKPSSTLPSIPLPHPGQSYNPGFQDHQDLLGEAVKVEMVKGKRERKIYNATDAMFPSKKDAPTQESWLKEMSGGLGRMVKLIGDNKDLKGAEKKMVKKKKLEGGDGHDDEGDDEDEEGDDEDEDEKDETTKNESTKKAKGDVDDEKEVNKNNDGKHMDDNDDNDDEEDDGDDDDDDGGDDNDSRQMQLSHNAAVRREDKKTIRERRKMNERKREDEKRKREKVVKGQLSQAFRVKSLRREVQREELTRAARHQHTLLTNEALIGKPKKLGKTRFTEAPTALKLTEEIKGDLRSLKPEGHVMSELVQSLQRRNVTPANNRRAAIKGRRYKVKVFEKKSHKEVTKLSCV